MVVHIAVLLSGEVAFGGALYVIIQRSYAERQRQEGMKRKEGGRRLARPPLLVKHSR